MLSDQWFLKVAPLAEPAIEAVRSGRTRFISPEWEKVYFNWMTDIRDWCVSRQLWWGPTRAAGSRTSPECRSSS